MKATHKLVTQNMTEHEVYFRITSGMWFTEDGCTGIPPHFVYSLTPLPSTKEPETFDWKEAMRKFADGVEVEEYHHERWFTCNTSENGVFFMVKGKYRVKQTSPPEPKVTYHWRNYYKDGRIGDIFYSLEEAEICNRANTICRLKITVTDGNSLPTVEVIPV